MSFMAELSWEHSWQAILLLIPLFLLLSRTILRRFSKRLNLPPSPPKLPFIGNLLQIGSSPHRALAALSNKYGPLMLLRLGQVPTLVVSSAEMAKEIMRTHDGVFCDRPSLKAPRIFMYGSYDVAFVPYGDYWRQTKKLCTLHLLSVRKVQSYNSMREEEVALLIDNIVEATYHSASKEVDMSDMLSSFINDLICKVVAGKRLREDGRNEVLRQMIKDSAIFFGGFFVEDFFPALGWLDELVGLSKSAKRLLKRWDVFLDQVIEEHLPHRVKDDEEKDFLHLFLAALQEEETNFTMTRDQIKGILVDLFAAGTDTSYVALEWALAELVRHPKFIKKAQNEVRERSTGKGIIRADELDKMVYLKAVVKEAMRLHPPTPLLLPRESMKDCQVQDYDIPKRTRVIINAWAISRDPRFWEDPEEFNPERFMASGSADFRGNDFQFIPFGAGRRICAGLPFAVASVELALANLLKQFEWELPRGLEELDIAEDPGLTLRKKEPLLLVATPWKP